MYRYKANGVDKTTVVSALTKPAVEWVRVKNTKIQYDKCNSTKVRGAMKTQRTST